MNTTGVLSDAFASSTSARSSAVIVTVDPSFVSVRVHAHCAVPIKPSR